MKIHGMKAEHVKEFCDNLKRDLLAIVERGEAIDMTRWDWIEGKYPEARCVGATIRLGRNANEGEGV